MDGCVGVWGSTWRLIYVLPLDARHVCARYFQLHDGLSVRKSPLTQVGKASQENSVSNPSQSFAGRNCASQYALILRLDTSSLRPSDAAPRRSLLTSPPKCLKSVRPPSVFSIMSRNPSAQPLEWQPSFNLSSTSRADHCLLRKRAVSGLGRIDTVSAEGGCS